MKKIFFTICIIALLISPVYASDAGAVNSSSMALTDTAGGGPGVTGIGKSAASYVLYSGAANAGYASSTAGQTMVVVAYSNKAIPAIQLTFGTRASNDTLAANTDDNSIYQLPSAGTSATPALAAGYVGGATIASWSTRGGS